MTPTQRPGTPGPELRGREPWPTPEELADRIQLEWSGCGDPECCGGPDVDESKLRRDVTVLLRAYGDQVRRETLADCVAIATRAHDYDRCAADGEPCNSCYVGKWVESEIRALASHSKGEP